MWRSFACENFIDISRCATNSEAPALVQVSFKIARSIALPHLGSCRLCQQHLSHTLYHLVTCQTLFNSFVGVLRRGLLTVINIRSKLSCCRAHILGCETPRTRPLHLGPVKQYHYIRGTIILFADKTDSCSSGYKRVDFIIHDVTVYI